MTADLTLSSQAGRTQAGTLNLYPSFHLGTVSLDWGDGTPPDVYQFDGTADNVANVSHVYGHGIFTPILTTSDGRETKVPTLQIR